MKKTMATKKSNKEGGVRLMRKVLLVMILFLVMGIFSTVAEAGIPLYYDLSILGLGTTGVFDRQAIATIDATSEYSNGLLPGATFTDTGDFAIGTFTLGGNPVGNDQGLNSAWQLTGRWTDLSGTVTSITPGVTDIYGNTGTLLTFNYTSGTAAAYGDTSIESGSFGPGIGSDDDTVGDFIDGTPLLSLSLLGGNGSLFIPDDPNVAPTGSVFLTWDIVDVPAGVWFDPFGNDLETVLENVGVAHINALVSQGINIVGNLIDPDPNAQGDEYYGPGTKIHSRNTGDVTYAVPEPTTMLLLGSGLLGLLGLGARRRRKVTS